jgi:hypothetical protein
MTTRSTISLLILLISTNIFAQEYWAAVRVDKEWVYINTKGKTVMNCPGRVCKNFSDGLALALVEKSWIYIDKTGKQAIKGEFEKAGPFKDGIAKLEESYIDKSGKIIAQDLTRTYNSFEGLARVMVGKELGFMDNTGKIVISPVYDDAGNFSEGLCPIKMDNTWGLVNKNGRITLKMSNKITYAYEVSSGVLPVRMSDGSGWRYMDTLGNIVSKKSYPKIEVFSDGLGKVGYSDDKKDYVAYVDRTGKEVIVLNISSAGSFSEGMAAVKIGDKWGFIDKMGKIVIPASFSGAKSFSGGLAAVKKEGLWGYIDKSGQFVIDPSFSAVEDFVKID